MKRRQDKLERKRKKAAMRNKRLAEYRSRPATTGEDWEWQQSDKSVVLSARTASCTYGRCGQYMVVISRFPDNTALLTIYDPGRRHNWQDMQRIKNEVLGEDWAGVEVYPRQELVVDEHDLYHLWCTPEPLHIGWDDYGTYTAHQTFYGEDVV